MDFDLMKTHKLTIRLLDSSPTEVALPAEGSSLDREP